ncbi:hypothetical protein QTP70_030214, partial [Hemibagrus guttatus]
TTGPDNGARQRGQTTGQDNGAGQRGRTTVVLKKRNQELGLETHCHRSPGYKNPACPESEVEDEEDLKRAGILKMTPHIQKKMTHKDTANKLQTTLAYQYNLKLRSSLRVKSERTNEGTSEPGSSALLNEICTGFHITGSWSGDAINEQVETASGGPATQQMPINCSDLFKDKSIRRVLTKGAAGIGKTISVQKFILDWSEGKANQDVLFVFLLRFRGLNLVKQENHSMIKLLMKFFPELKEFQSIDCESYRVMFLFDGLDECRLPLNFHDNERMCDVPKSASVGALLTNLIKDNLLPSALLWITSRPGAASQIPPECIDQVTELRGFSDPQKEEYFRKKISDQSLADKIITHIKCSRSLYVMCHIPVFCWISATVLERMLGEAESGEIPKAQMYTHFLIFQIKHKDQKCHRIYDLDSERTKKRILALGKLVFHHLEKGNVILYDEDLRECGTDVREVPVFPGLCEQILEFDCCKGKMFNILWKCGLREESCRALSSALSSNWSRLRELELGENKLQDSGVKLLCAGLENPHCRLETLGLSNRSVRDEGFADLASALRSSPSSRLRELDLKVNEAGDSGVKVLTDLQNDPQSKLEMLHTGCCSIQFNEQVNLNKEMCPT